MTTYGEYQIRVNQKRSSMSRARPGSPDAIGDTPSTNSPLPTTTGPDPSESAIEDAYTKLSSMLGGMKDVDFDALFSPYIQKAKEKELPRTPGRGEAFARGFGSKEGSRSVMEEIAGHKEARKSRDESISQLEHALLGAKMKQEIEKGSADKALKTLEQTKLLDQKLQLHKEDRDLKTWKEKEDYEANLKSMAAQERHEFNVALVEKKAREVGSRLGLPEKVILELLKRRGALAQTRLNEYAQGNIITGKKPTPEQAEEMENIVEGDFMDYARRLMEEAGQGGVLDQSAPLEKKSRARMIAEKKLADAEAKKKGKK